MQPRFYAKAVVPLWLSFLTDTGTATEEPNISLQDLFKKENQADNNSSSTESNNNFTDNPMSRADALEAQAEARMHAQDQLTTQEALSMMTDDDIKMLYRCIF